MALLRKLTEARIACANSFHEFNTLDSITDEWNTAADEVLEATALDIHLDCESGAKEAHTVLDILTGFLTFGVAPEWLWMEADVRQENAVGAADDITRILGHLQSVNDSPELSLKEMKRRASMIKTKMEGLKATMEELRMELQRATQRQQQARTAQDQKS